MKNYVALLLACTGLAACGGGGGGGGGSAGLAPVAAPPAPAAATTNSTLTNLVASQAFPTVGGSINTVANSNGTFSQTSLVTASADIVGVSYNASNQSYTITSNIGSQAFAASDRNAASSNNLITTYTKRTGNVQDDLILANGPAAGFTYSNFGSWVRTTDNTTSVAVHNSYAVYGIPTAAADMPRTGSATYATAGGATQVAGNTLRALSGTGSLTANFGTGNIQTSLALGGFGTLSGSATINSNNATFSGGMGGAGYSGALAGRFFGPAAAEVGATFTMTSTLIGTAAAIDGYLIGKK